MNIANLLLDVWGINVGQSLSVFDVLNEWNQYGQIWSKSYDLFMSRNQFMNINLNLNSKLIHKLYLQIFSLFRRIIKKCSRFESLR